MLLFCIHPMMSAAKVTSNISKLMTSLKLMLFTPFPLLSIRKIMKRGSTAYRVLGNAQYKYRSFDKCTTYIIQHLPSHFNRKMRL